MHRAPQDMTTLAYLNEPGVLDNLKARYVVDDIYTYTGSILIAVNPFARLPHLYGTHMMEQYRGELSPFHCVLSASMDLDLFFEPRN